MKLITAILIGLIGTSSALASDLASVQSQLTQELVGKHFELRVPVAGNTCLYSNTAPVSSLVDTEMSDSTLPRYYLRTERFMHFNQCSAPLGRIDNFMSGAYLSPQMISTMHQPGTMMTVQSIEAKSDRIEIKLLADGETEDEGYGKLKFILAKGYESKTLEELEIQINRALILPAIDAVQRNRGQLHYLQSQIDQIEAGLQLGNSITKINNLKNLIALYRVKSGLEKKLQTAGIDVSAIAATDKRIEELSANLKTAQAIAIQEGVNSAEKQYFASLASMKGACERAYRVQADSIAAIDSSRANINEARTSLQAFAAASQGLAALKIPFTKADQDLSASCSVTIEANNNGLDSRQADLQKKEEDEARARENEKVRAEIAALDSEFAKLKREQVVLDRDLASALFSGQDRGQAQSADRQKLVSMYQNREQAFRLGKSSAAAEMDTIQGQIQKLN